MITTAQNRIDRVPVLEIHYIFGVLCLITRKRFFGITRSILGLTSTPNYIFALDFSHPYGVLFALTMFKELGTEVGVTPC